VAAKALGRIGNKNAVKPLIETLKDKDYEVRLWAARALADIGDNEAVPHLRSLWKSDPKRPVKVVAAGGVFRFDKDTDAYKYLKEALSDDDNRIRALAVEQICKTEYKGSVDLVIERLNNDSEAIVRQAAASALGNMQEKRAVRSLIARLNDKEPLVRESAAKALEQIGEKKAVEPLIALLGDKEDSVSSAAASALQKITGKGLGTDQAKWKAWHKHEKDLHEALENLKKDPRSELLGVVALGALKDRRGIEPLIELLGSMSEDFDIGLTKRVVVEALKDITGQDFGTDHDKWKEWFEQNKDKYDEKRGR
jgi:HEAT repeat protein